MTMELWTSATPNGWKVTIMLDELKQAGIDLPENDVVTVDLFNREQFSDAFTEVSPNQKIPGLRDGETTVMESCAILLYLAEKYPSPLLPQDESRWDAIQWLFWQAAGVGPAFGNKLAYTRYMDDVPAEQKSHPLARFNNEAQRLLRVMNKQLQGKDFLCGDQFTIADIACYPWIRGWKWSKVDITLHNNGVAWVERVRARLAALRPGSNAGELEGQDQRTVQGGLARARLIYRC